MLTPIDLDESVGVVLARCYRLARERARAVHAMREGEPAMTAEDAIDQESELAGLLREAAESVGSDDII
jgi:hypothetical protein